MKFDVKVEWNRPVKQIAEKAAGGDAGALFLANEVKRLMDPYVPADSLVLAQNVRTYVENGEGIVHYQSPYAHYQYEGEIYGPNYPIKDGGEITGWWSPPRKTPTGRKMKHNTFRHPLATSHWDQAMLRARKRDLLEAIETYLNRR